MKFVLVLLMILGFAVGCEKSESKTELEWITPNEKVCIKNGGKMKDGICNANRLDSIRIYFASGGVFPNFDKLEKVVTDCGGMPITLGSKKWTKLGMKNSENFSYQSCYKTKGFTSHSYLSSTSIISFEEAIVFEGKQEAESSIRCIKNGQ